jgi:hypothetical protein
MRHYDTVFALMLPALSFSQSFSPVATHPARNIYAVDGVNIHIYSPDGRYEKSLTPGINMTMGLAALDPQHLYVTGRLVPEKAASRATVFRLGPCGIDRSFSNVFITGLSGMDDHLLNSSSFLALDRQRGRLYQIPQYAYEIRVFDLDGKLLHTIAPPTQYRIRAPQLQHLPNAGVSLEPGDALGDISVLPDGGLAVTGDVLDSSSTKDRTTSVSYSRFVDVYGADGVFKRRLSGDQLKLAGAFLLAFDHESGKAYFRDPGSVVEAVLQ